MTFPKTAPAHHPITPPPPPIPAHPLMHLADDGFCVLWIIYYLFTLGTYFICVNARELYARKCTHPSLCVCTVVYKRAMTTRVKKDDDDGRAWKPRDGVGASYLWPRCCLVGGAGIKLSSLVFGGSGSVSSLTCDGGMIRKEKPREKR